MNRGYLIAAGLALAWLFPALAAGGDWPQWRYDAARRAASPDELPAQLSLHWVRQLPPLVPCWPDQPKMQFDAAYEPVIAGQRMFVGSSRDNSVTAYDTRTGELAWQFFAEGPVRFAPAVGHEQVYFASDDGYLYCLRAGDGTLAWRFRGGPSDRKVLGNERMISMWPARGAPVVVEDQVYFAAGIWPFMGIFLHALDAKSGRVIWTNDGDGSIYIKQPHNSDSFAGVAPQGPLAVAGDRLLVPGGRSVPACYDRHSGKLLYYQLAENGKRGGGSAVSVAGPLLLNGGAAFDLETERYLASVGQLTVFRDGKLHDYRDGDLRTIDLATSPIERKTTADRKGEKTTDVVWIPKTSAKVTSPKLTALIQAGSRLYGGSAGQVCAFELPLPKEGSVQCAWELPIEGTPASLVAADDRLFVVTVEGRVYCFGGPPGNTSPRRHELVKAELASDAAAVKGVKEVLEAIGSAMQIASGGYCLVVGPAKEGQIAELVRQSQLRLIVVEPDAPRATQLRTKLSAAGVFGDRVTVLVAEPEDLLLPPYFASLAIVSKLPDGDAGPRLIAKVYESLRPYGGVACLVGATSPNEFRNHEQLKGLAGANWQTAGKLTLLSRSGPLPGAADWTHEHADAANTRVSKDQLVKAPLGLLWFGGPSNDAILPRHGHGPQPQVVQGRLFIEGVDLLRAMDIYTGRVLWEASLPGVGAFYNNTAHQPGANSSGTNFIATPEGIYVAHQNACLVLDPATGQRKGQFQLPVVSGNSEPPLWGYLNVFENYLVGGADPLLDPSLPKSKDNDNFSASRRLVVMDRTSGKVLWSADAISGFRHNAICLGGGRLYCIDRPSGAEVARLARRGEKPKHAPHLVAFDLATGKKIWSTDKDVFGTWLSYSAERDVLVEAGRKAGDTLTDEPKGMRAYAAAGGKPLWENMGYSGPAMIHHDTILMAGSGCDLLSGAKKMREHPLSGEPVEWTWSRNYGCNTPAASEHLLTFRSGAAGYLDYCSDGGTGNFGGFRSSCTNNLIVAGGVLTAPDYTRTCTCSYQNQTSIALVHMPEAEVWTSFGSQAPEQRVRRLGLNLGAPGDRKAEDGTLWLEVPSVGGNSPPVEVQLSPAEPQWFRRHSAQVSGPGLAWVAASGAQGLSSISVRLADDDKQPRRYTVRLHFLEPEDVVPGQRVFHVSLQGKRVIAALDVVKEAGGRNRSLVKEITGVEVGEVLQIELTPDPSAAVPRTLLSGIEIQAEGW